MSAWRRWLRFNGVGLLGVGVQVAPIAWMVNVCGLDYRVATTTGVALAVTHNFIWHWRWTWRDRARPGHALKTLLRFALTNGAVSTMGNLAAMRVLVGVLGLAVAPASLVAIAGCGLVNYWLGDKVVFNDTGYERTSVPRVL
jgi:putative flippase GtrA